MPRNNDEGIFRIFGKNHKFALTEAVYCRIINIKLLSPLRPAQKRMVTYSACYWTVDPQEDDFATPPEILEHVETHQYEFAFTLPYQEFTADELEYLCTNHLLTEVGVSSIPSNSAAIYATVFPLKRWTSQYNIYGLYQAAPLTAVKHIEHYQEYSNAVIGLPVELVISKAVITRLDNTVVDVSCPLGSDNTWVRTAFSALIAPTQYKKYAVIFPPSLG